MYIIISKYVYMCWHIYIYIVYGEPIVFMIDDQYIDITCLDGYKLTILPSNNDYIPLQLIDCDNVLYTYQLNINNCYIFGNQCNRNLISSVIQSSINDTNTASILNIITNIDNINVTITVTASFQLDQTIEFLFIPQELTTQYLNDIIRNLRSDIEQRFEGIKYILHAYNIL